MSTVVPVEWLLLASLLVSACTCAVLMYRKGFVSGGRFAEADTFPTDYFAACSALAAFAISLGVVALRIAAEVQLVGIGGIMWVGDIAIGVVYFIQFAMLIYLVCYGSFVVAKRSRVAVFTPEDAKAQWHDLVQAALSSISRGRI